MDPKKTCSRCQRLIDARSRMCPYCNQEQVIETIDGEEREVTESSPAPTSPIALGRRRSVTRQVILAIGGIALMVGMFFIGWMVYAWGQPDSKKGPLEKDEEVEARADRPTPDLTLVADGSGIPDVERAYTSRLAETLNADLPEEFQRRDATALPIAVYQRVAEEERRREREQRSELVDPRDVTQSARPSRGRPSAPAPPSQPLPTSSSLGEIPGNDGLPKPSQPDSGSSPQRASQEQPAEPAAASEPVTQRTRPKPLSQPLPRVSSRTPGTVRVSLTVGSDGEVANVRVVQGMPGVTPQVVSAVNRWKFQPATVGGQPVESTYEVEIVVKPNR